MGSISDIIAALTPVRRGDDVTKVASSTRINAIQEAIFFLLKGENIKLGPGMRKGSTLGSVTIRGGDGRGGRGGGSNRVWNYSTDSNEGRHTITFKDGLVNNVLAKNMGEKISLKSGKNYLFALGKASGGSIEQVVVIADTEKRSRLIEAKNAPPGEVPVLIALAVVDGENVSVTRLRFRNVICTPSETRRSGKKPASAGEEAFDRYYSWSISDPDR
jgi:hypothetical protein